MKHNKSNIELIFIELNCLPVSVSTVMEMQSKSFVNAMKCLTECRFRIQMSVSQIEMKMWIVTVDKYRNMTDEDLQMYLSSKSITII